MALVAHDMANSEGDSYTLRERLEELPQELYDMIYDFTFTAEAKVRLYSRGPESKYGHGTNCVMFHELAQAYPKDIVTINEIPRLLHVDRASRKNSSESSYGNPNSFFVVSLGSVPESKTLLKLVKSLHMGVGRWDTGVLHRSWKRFIALWVGRPEESFTFIRYEEIEALLKKRAGIADSASAGL